MTWGPDRLAAARVLRRQIARDAEAGVSPRDLAVRHKVCLATVYNAMHEHRVTTARATRLAKLDWLLATDDDA